MKAKKDVLRFFYNDFLFNLLLIKKSAERTRRDEVKVEMQGKLVFGEENYREKKILTGE